MIQLQTHHLYSPTCRSTVTDLCVRSSMMADDLDIEAMLEAPFRKVRLT